MPSVSEKQARTMSAAAHDPEFAKKMGIDPAVAKEWNRHDKGSKLLSDAMKDASKKKKDTETTATAEAVAPPSASW